MPPHRMMRGHGSSAASQQINEKSTGPMVHTEQDRWSRVKGRLRASSVRIFIRAGSGHDLEDIRDGKRTSVVPTRFSKSWIQTHYADRLLQSWQGGTAAWSRASISPCARRCATPRRSSRPSRPMRSAATRAAPLKRAGTATAPVSASHEALGGSPLDPRLTSPARHRPLQHAALCRRQAGGGRPPW